MNRCDILRIEDGLPVEHQHAIQDELTKEKVKRDASMIKTSGRSDRGALARIAGNRSAPTTAPAAALLAASLAPAP
jgi:hypothetical protein